MTTGITLRLSDDELVALAVRAGGEWKAFLPTIDTSDLDALMRAQLRGERSLALRQGRLTASGSQISIDEVVQMIAPAITSAPTVIGYSSPLSDPDVADGPSFAAFRTGDKERLLVATTAGGLSEIEVVAVDRVSLLIEAFGHAAGADAQAGRAAVILFPSDEGGGNAFVVNAEGTSEAAYSIADPRVVARSRVAGIPAAALSLI